MTERTTTHATFTLERHYQVPPERVFAAWADPVAKARWFAGGQSGHSLDFRVGGTERNRAGHEGTEYLWLSRYHDIVAAVRIVYSSTLSSDGALATMSQTTVELHPEGDGTLLVLTEQGAYLDGHELPAWREQGTSDWLDSLGEELAATVGLG
jgi:uncharacterized protein YndB with AHSA1/START domain